MPPAQASRFRRVISVGASIASVVLATTGAFWLLNQGEPEEVVATLLVSRPSTVPDDVGFDVTLSRGCGSGDLPGFTRARWANAQSGFLRADGTAYLQCQIHEWADESAAVADFAERVTLLDGVATFTGSRQPDDRMQRLTTVNDSPAVVSFVERSRDGDVRSTMISVVHVGDFAGVVTVHSYVDPPIVALSEFEKLVANVLVRMHRSP